MLSLFLRKSKQRTWNKIKHIVPGLTGQLFYWSVHERSSVKDLVVYSGAQPAKSDLIVQEPENGMIVLIALDGNHTQRWRWDSLLNSKCL